MIYCTGPGSILFHALGLMKFVPSVAKVFRLALPGSFLNGLCLFNSVILTKHSY